MFGSTITDIFIPGLKDVTLIVINFNSKLDVFSCDALSSIGMKDVLFLFELKPWLLDSFVN